MRRLDLIVGPNGAGKSTIVDLVLARRIPGSVFVNADLIAAQRWPQDPADHAYEAAEIAAATRSALIASGQPFIAETVFSHPSKVDLVREALLAGYTVVLHVVLVTEDLAVERVAHRARAGGHDVPEHKIRERFRRLWELVAQAAERADSTTFYDNSRLDGPRIVATLSGGQVVGHPTWPDWASTALRSRWPT
ncbi:MAG TPA: zeta toxin family protein [Nakamurella sp.]